MIQTIYFNHSSTFVFPLAPFGVNIKGVRGVYSGATAKVYLQLHQGTQNSPSDNDITKPADGAYPIEQWEILAGTNVGPFQFDFDPITDAPVPSIFVLSSTAGILTAASGESLLDLSVDIEVSGDPLLWNATLNTAQQVPAGYTLYKNNSLSAVQQIWADGSPHALLEIVSYQNSGTVVNPAGNTVAFLKLYTVNPTTNVTLPWMQIPVVNNLTAPFQRNVFWDNVGNGPIPQTGTAGALSEHTGLFVSMETAPGKYVSGNVVAYKIQVKYL